MWVNYVFFKYSGNWIMDLTPGSIPPLSLDCRDLRWRFREGPAKAVRRNGWRKGESIVTNTGAEACATSLRQRLREYPKRGSPNTRSFPPEADSGWHCDAALRPPEADLTTMTTRYIYFEVVNYKTKYYSLNVDIRKLLDCRVKPDNDKNYFEFISNLELSIWTCLGYWFARVFCRL